MIFQPCLVAGSSRSSDFPTSFFGSQTTDSEEEIYNNKKASFLESLQNARSRGDKSSELKILIQLGELEYFYGFSAKARDYFKSAVPLADTINENAKKGRLLQLSLIHI